ncbi:ABC transporter permease [Roseococcus sp. SDR]|uniref:ABC transporter permease n=1 Tax=Roseococcus sp. SDR TaxID=2835532 RepID=UPI001BCEAD36|nr:ABC transporter permease [Roseococcus sp. SDR]MBS7789501.1 ABC transporter permease [Roseococcus sp. SDR]MBV1844815.1 ABC transporter permease [Roseococcus sp. SDR]
MGGVARALLRRAVQAALVVILVSALCFTLVRILPGDQALRIAEGRYGYDRVTAAAADAVRAELGLDRPAIEQFAAWVGRLARGDLGASLVTGERVVAEVAYQLGHSLMLALAALAIALVIGPILGLFAGLRPGGVVDQAGMVGAAALRAMPVFALGIGLMLVFGVALGWLPVAGFHEAENIILPALALGLGLAAASARVARDATVAVTSAPFFRFALLRGLTRAQAVWQHVPRNAAVPVLAYLGVQLALLVEGVVVVESLFGWPGIGHALSHAIAARDVPMLQGTALSLGLIFVALNAATDLAMIALDPRRR